LPLDNIDSCVTYVNLSNIKIPKIIDAQDNENVARISAS
jgi:hypothetical protein